MTRPEEATAPPGVDPAELTWPSLLNFNPNNGLSLRRALAVAREMQLEELMALLLFYSSHSRANTLDLTKEVRRMAETQKNQIDLTKSVVGLMADYSQVAMLIEREVVNLRATMHPETDPAVSESLHRITDLVLTIKKAEMDVRGALQAEVQADARDAAQAAAQTQAVQRG